MCLILFQDGFMKRFSSSEFVLLSQEMEDFMIQTEAMCGCVSVSLRSCLQSKVCLLSPFTLSHVSINSDNSTLTVV